MSRLTRALLVGLALVLLLVPALAMAADPLMPGRPKGAPAYVGISPPLYENDQFPAYAYTFEGDIGINGFGQVPLYFWMNLLLASKAWLLKLAIRIAEYAVLTDFLSPFRSQATAALAAFGQVLWTGSGPLVA
ncbi:MAG: hypothetical protein JWN15_2775, partial [Firmicutes bacterium]|nr:hypothetical protein [Bacillota bacterium]